MLNLDKLMVTEQHNAPIGAPMSEFRPTLSEEEKATARALYLALKQFTTTTQRDTMPLQYVMTYLLVAMEEGKGVTELAKIAEVPPTVMTRHLLDIGDRNRAKEEGFGLIAQERDRNDLRRTHAKFTPKGRALLHRMMTALKSVPR